MVSYCFSDNDAEKGNNEETNKYTDMEYDNLLAKNLGRCNPTKQLKPEEINPKELCKNELFFYNVHHQYSKIK